MAQFFPKSDNLSHLTGFGVNSNVSGFLNVIVYVNTFVLLLDRVHGVLLDLDTPP